MSVSFEHLICVCQFLFLVFSILTFVFFCQLKLFQFARLSLSFPFAACKEIGIHSMYCMPVRVMMMMVMMMVMMMMVVMMMMMMMNGFGMVLVWFWYAFVWFWYGFGMFWHSCGMVLI